MALYSNLNRCLCRYYLRVISSINISKQCKQNIHEKAITLETDILDNFTSQLIQRKTDKWIAQRTTQKLVSETNINASINVNKGNNCDTEIQFLSIEEINSLFQDSIEVGDNSKILDLIIQCIKFRKCPSLSNLIHVLTLCAQSGDKQMILQIEKLCEEFHPDVLKANSNFQHYLAEAIWVRGNITESLKIFKEVYRENTFLRRRIRLMFKYLILDVVSNRSEAALVNIISFSEELLENYKDFFPITCVWQACFLSQLFIDQRLALELLETNEGLCQAVVHRIPYVVSVSLYSHRTEVVYRLLEMLLKFKMKTDYSGVLLSLLDYQIRQRDLRSCTEIIHWSIKNNVELPQIHHEKFLTLLLNYDIEISSLKEKLKAIKRNKMKTNFKF